MPKLPDPGQIERATPRPEQGIVTYRAGIESAAEAELGQTLFGFGTEVLAFGKREKARMDGVVVDDAKNNYLEKKLALEGEYRQILGKDAVNIRKIYDEKLSRINDEVLPMLKNSAQKQEWNSFYEKDKINFSAGVLQHELNQSDKYAEDTHNDTVNIQTKNGLVNFTDEKIINESANNITISTTKEAIRTGKQELLDAALIKNLGPLWGGVTAQHINAKNYEEAERLLEQHKDVIGAADYSKYHAAIVKDKEYDQVELDVIGFSANYPEATNKDILDYFTKKYPEREDLKDRAVVGAKTIKTATEQARTQKEKAATQRVAGLLNENKLTHPLIDLSEMSNTKKAEWHGKLDTKNTKGFKYKSDEVIRATLRMRANTDPANLTDNEIWDSVYQKKGITDAEAQAVQKRRDEKLKALEGPGEKSNQNSLKRAHDTLKRMQGLVEVDEGEASDFLIKSARQHEDLDDYMEANPDADPLKYVGEKFKPEVNKNIFSQLIRNLFTAGPLAGPFLAAKKITERDLTPEENVKREKATQWLADRDQEVTEDRIKWVIENRL